MKERIYQAAIYLRLSKEDGDIVDSTGKTGSDSINNQRNLINEFLKTQKNIEVVSERVDDGYSGTNFDRPAFISMMEEFRKAQAEIEKKNDAKAVSQKMFKVV